MAGSPSGLKVRPARPEELLIGLKVWYESEEKGMVKSTVMENWESDSETVRLDSKSHARLEKVHIEESQGEQILTRPSIAQWQESFVSFLQNVFEKSKASQQSMAQQLLSEIKVSFGDLDNYLSTVKEVVPMNENAGYVNFRSVPKTSKKGNVHVTFLAMDEASFPGNGMFLSDSILLAKTSSWDHLATVVGNK